MGHRRQGILICLRSWWSIGFAGLLGEQPRFDLEPPISDLVAAGVFGGTGQEAEGKQDRSGEWAIVGRLADEGLGEGLGWHGGVTVVGEAALDGIPGKDVSRPAASTAVRGDGQG